MIPANHVSQDLNNNGKGGSDAEMTDVDSEVDPDTAETGFTGDGRSNTDLYN
jgi:hypothetical protein